MAMLFAIVPMKRSQKGKTKNYSSLFCIALPHPSSAKYSRWVEDVKKISFHFVDLLTGNTGSKTPLATSVLVTWQAWQSAFGNLVIFIKDIIPKVNNSNFWKETDQTKNLQLAKRKRIISVFCWWITWNPVKQGSLCSFLTKVPNTSLMSKDEVKIWQRISAIHRNFVIS